MTSEVPDRMSCCKMGKVACKYGLQKYLSQELRGEWESASGASLRDLAQKFNYRVLRTKIADAGETPLEGEVKDIYESLRSTDEMRSANKRAKKRLAEYGVDGDEIRDDFVSYRTVDRHFKNCEERTRDKIQASDTDTIESAVDRIRALEKRLQIVSDKTLEDLANAERIPLGKFEVTVNSRVTCNECENQFSISKAIRSGCPVCNNADAEMD